jgi:mRNA interferase MazF
VRLDFDPQAGHEQARRRPAVVLSPADYNRTLGLAVVCPFTNESKGFPWEVAVPAEGHVSGVVLADQVKSMDWRARNVEFVCTADQELLDEVVQKVVALIDPEDE